MSSDNTPETTERNWAYIISPFIVVIVLLLCLIIYEYATVRGGESKAYITLYVLASIPYALITLSIDIFIKRFLRHKEQKAGYIWAIESVLLICCAILLYYFFKSQN